MTAEHDNFTKWRCAACDIPLEKGAVEIAYMGSSFPVELSRCSRCGIVFIPEELALKRMAEAEQILEDK